MKNILFIQGGGDDGYKADATLVQNLQNELGKNYHLLYPKLKTDETAPDFGRIKQISKEIDDGGDDVIVIAHSLGASLLLKYLSENNLNKKIAAVFLLATPFWSGNEGWKQGLKLRDDFPVKLPTAIPLFFYHCRDDDEVPFEQFKSYKHLLTKASFREFENGGHQFNGRLDIIVTDIKALAATR